MPSLLPQNQSQEGPLGPLFPGSYMAGILPFPALKPASTSFTSMAILFGPLANVSKSLASVFLLLPLASGNFIYHLEPSWGRKSQCPKCRILMKFGNQFNTSSMRTNKEQLGIIRSKKKHALSIAFLLSPTFNHMVKIKFKFPGLGYCGDPTSLYSYFLLENLMTVSNNVHLVLPKT